MSNSEKIKPVPVALTLLSYALVSELTRRRLYRNLLEGFGVTLKTLLGLAMPN